MLEDELLVVAQFKSNPSRYTSTLTMQELVDEINVSLPVREVFVHVPTEQGYALQHVGSIQAGFLGLEHAPLPDKQELDRQVIMGALHSASLQNSPSEVTEASVSEEIPEEVSQPTSKQEKPAESQPGGQNEKLELRGTKGQVIPTDTSFDSPTKKSPAKKKVTRKKRATRKKKATAATG